MATQTLTGIDPFTGSPHALTIVDGKIAAIAPFAGTADTYLGPGLIDLQVNGYGGLDLNDGALTADTVTALSRLLLSRGVTRYLPTIITASEADIVAALAAITEAVARDPLAAATIAGIHVEGPSFFPEDGPRGAHPREHVRAPDIAEFARWQAAAGGLIRMVTLSPHWPQSTGYIAQLSAQGIVVAIGHTDATAQQIHAAAAAGARMSTHLGNGAAAMLPRHPNFIWAQLANDSLWASFIADGHHLPGDTLKAMLRAKGLERSILVSDSAALGGMAPGVYSQRIGGEVEVSAEGRLSVAGTPYLAGAARTLSENVAIAIKLAGLSLAQSLRLATHNPAAMLGKPQPLSVGARADLIRFRVASGADALDIVDVWIAGERVTL